MPADYAAVADVNRAAFGQDAEAILAARLRAEGYALVEMVAEYGNRIVGHILFSVLEIEKGTAKRAAALGPLAVVPEMQRRGIGGELIMAGLERVRKAGVDLVLVLGHASYYPRFGFSSQHGLRVASPYRGAGDSWMAIELTADALGDTGTAVRYPPPWSAV